MTSTESRQRIHAIAARTWVPVFESTLGLSEEERDRKAASGAALQREQLLRDRPEHLISFPAVQNSGTEAARFNLKVPQYQFNFGELHNLLINHGTLTPEERYVIQSHSVHTILMLEQLPFPAHLQRVTEYACNHHEKMNGHGYPRGLDHERLSIPARILAIADIFEALTARDRPYKPPMHVSQALGVMHDMCARGELDSDLFALFRASGVIEEYGRGHLHPDQMH